MDIEKYNDREVKLQKLFNVGIISFHSINNMGRQSLHKQIEQKTEDALDFAINSFSDIVREKMIFERQLLFYVYEYDDEVQQLFIEPEQVDYSIARIYRDPFENSESIFSYAELFKLSSNVMQKLQRIAGRG